ncbi:MAG: hypothetical protein QHJ82_14320, partial [Verrucomicrobiota bacterium]|nr:hypothetical protein [Verrucomicrobiota bacterium]
FEADLVDDLDLGEPVGNEGVAQAVALSFQLCRRADLVEALFVRPLERTNRTGFFRKGCQPQSTVVGDWDSPTAFISLWSFGR